MEIIIMIIITLAITGSLGSALVLGSLSGLLIKTIAKNQNLKKAFNELYK